MTDFDFVVNDVTYKIKRPTATQRYEAQRIYNRTLNQAIADGCMVKEQVQKFAEERGIITPEKDAEIEALRKQIIDLEKQLDQGGVELEVAKEWALKLRELRADLLVKSLVLAQLLSNTAERQAEIARDEYIISVVICNQHGVPVCKNFDDFLARRDDPVIMAGEDKFLEVNNGISYDFVKDLPENKFLLEYGFMDDNFRMSDDPEPEKPPEKKPFLKNGEPVLNGG